MRKMKIAVFVCLTIAAVLLGQSVWACPDIEKFTWYWCGPNQKQVEGSVWTWTSSETPDTRVEYIRGRLFRAPLCEGEGCCDEIDAGVTPDGYLFILFDANFTYPVDNASASGAGPQWGDFWIGSSSDPNAIPLWQGTFTGNGDNNNNRFQRLVGSGLGDDNEGMKLRALCETINTSTNPKYNDHIINGYIQKPHHHGH